MGKVVTLACSDGTKNHNKFYRLTQDDDGNGFTAEWARIGDKPSTQHYVGDAQAMERKQREKMRPKKNKRNYQEVPILYVPQDAINRQVSLSTKGMNPEGDDAINAFLRTIERANRHQIAVSSGGKIEVDESGLTQTELGVIHPDALTEARTILENAQADKTAWTLDRAERYLILVPQKVKTVQDFFEGVDLQAQVDFVDQLQTSVGLWQARMDQALKADHKDADADKASNPFRYTLTPATDEEFARCEKKFNEGVSTKHQRAATMKLRRVYRVTDNQDHVDEWSAIKEKSHNWSRKLWHGTRTENLLSILFKGFYVPPTRGSSVAIAGRMFGDGVYFATSSTKSLNYSIGFWGGAHAQRGYMLLNDVVTGWEYRTSAKDTHVSAQKWHGQSSSKGHPYDSLFVQRGTCGVINDEIIVRDPARINVEYICEFS